jgi:hypothetical protein
MTGGPNIIEVEVLSVSSGEPSDLAKVAHSSHAEGPMAFMRMGCDPYQWGGPCLTWLDQNQQEASSESSDLAEVAQSARTEGPVAFMREGMIPTSGVVRASLG